MKRSSDRILTTHVGSLVRPDDLQSMIAAREAGAPHDPAALAARVSSAVGEVVRRQAATGIDIVNDGEFSKASWSAYFRTRLANVETRPGRRSTPGNIWQRDEPLFPEWFEGVRHTGGPRYSPILRALIAARGERVAPLAGNFCVGPLRYIGAAEVETDIANLKAATRDVAVEERCLTALAPPIMAYFLANEYYRSEEEFLFAIAEAMNEEYRAITDAGIVLQIDEPAIATNWHFLTSLDVPAYRRWLAPRIEAINVALRGIDPARVRMHTCWGSIHQPHTQDLPLEHIVDMILQVNVGAYSLEASNPRHDHEWTVWKSVRLPEGKILIPGVIGHYTDMIEHPALVAERIMKYASVVGRENVIAGVDCGLGTRVGHERIVWAKLAALAEGAQMASGQLFG